MVDHEVNGVSVRDAAGDTVHDDELRDSKMNSNGNGYLLDNSVTPNKRVTFSDTEVPRNGLPRARPSVPGPSVYERRNNNNNNSYGDSQFTENISRQMRVPHQIRPYEDDSNNFYPSESTTRGTTMQQMSVPDRILVAGNDQHMGFRDNRPRELDFDDMLYGFRGEPSVQVQTPPRTLTVNQHSFPAANGTEVDQFTDGPIIHPMSGSVFSDNTEQMLTAQAERNMLSSLRQQRSSAVRSGGATTQSALRAGLPDTPGSRLVIDLYKRVELLERENYHRYLREMVGYALVIGFVALKGLSLFLKR